MQNAIGTGINELLEPIPVPVFTLPIHTQIFLGTPFISQSLSLTTSPEKKILLTQNACNLNDLPLQMYDIDMIKLSKQIEPTSSLSLLSSYDHNRNFTSLFLDQDEYLNTISPFTTTTTTTTTTALSQSSNSIIFPHPFLNIKIKA